jgi:hypothetical protein
MMDFWGNDPVRKSIVPRRSFFCKVQINHSTGILTGHDIEIEQNAAAFCFVIEVTGSLTQ